MLRHVRFFYHVDPNEQFFLNMAIIAFLLLMIITSNNGHPFDETNLAMCGRNYKDTGKTVSDRIVGGREAQANEMPWMVSLQSYDQSTKSWRHDCGGSIIDPQIIMTAAHCIPENGTSNRIIAGCRKHDNEHCICQVVEFKVSDFFPHPEYDKFSSARYFMWYDIALIRLRSKFKFSNQPDRAVGPICLYKDGLPDLKANDTALTAGWGCTVPFYVKDGRPANLAMSESLKAVQVTVHPEETCTKIWGLYGVSGWYDNDVGLCVTSAVGDGICPGDSGGPLIMRYEERDYAMGIVSYSEAAGMGPEYPGLFARVRYYLQWISDTADRILKL
jgi:secreted trypsin-like serine protease